MNLEILSLGAGLLRIPGYGSLAYVLIRTGWFAVYPLLTLYLVLIGVRSCVLAVAPYAVTFRLWIDPLVMLLLAAAAFESGHYCQTTIPAAERRWNTVAGIAFGLLAASITVPAYIDKSDRIVWFSTLLLCGYAGILFYGILILITNYLYPPDFREALRSLENLGVITAAAALEAATLSADTWIRPEQWELVSVLYRAGCLLAILFWWRWLFVELRAFDDSLKTVDRRVKPR